MVKAHDTTKQLQKNTTALVVLTDAKVAGLKAKDEAYEVRDSKVQGLRLRIGTSGKKTWTLRARVPGASSVMVRKLGTYPGMGLATARSEAIAALETVGREGSVASLDRTFGQVGREWLEKVAARNTIHKLQLRRLEMHVFPKWENRKLSDIRRSDVRDLLEGLEGKSLPNMILATIRPVFKYAASRDWIETVPTDGVEKPLESKSRDRVLDMAEMVRVWNAAEHMGFPFSQWVRTLLLTAQRRTEVASMRRGTIDLAAATWTLSADETKAGRAHLVPLSGQVVTILKSTPKFGDEYVFTTDGKSHVSGYARAKQRLDQFIERDGNGPMAPWTFHDLRRTAATHMVRLGVLEEVVGKVLNHASQGVTAKVYALHRYEKEKREALELWANEVMRAVGGGKVVQLRPVK